MKPYYQKMKGGSTMRVPGMYEGGSTMNQLSGSSGPGKGRFRNWFNRTFNKGVHLPGTGKAKVRKRRFSCKNGVCR